MGLRDLGESLWDALGAVLATLWGFIWQWLLQPVSQALWVAVTALGFGLQAGILWIWSGILSAAATLLDLLWRYVLHPIVKLMAHFVWVVAAAVGGLVGIAALANVAADWLGLGSFVDLIVGRRRARPPTQF